MSTLAIDPTFILALGLCPDVGAPLMALSTFLIPPIAVCAYACAPFGSAIRIDCCVLARVVSIHTDIIAPSGVQVQVQVLKLFKTFGF